MGEILRVSDIDSNTEITIPTGEGPITMSVAAVIRWVAPGAPPQEALKFLMKCRAAEVNPFLDEADLIQMGSSWETIINKAGWLRRAEMHPAFEGWQAGIVVQPVDASTKPPTPLGPPEDHEGALQLPGYRLLGGWCKVYRSDRKLPTVARVALSEYKGRGPNWDERAATMIRKVALVQGLREAGFLPKGAYDRDELRVEREVATARVHAPGSNDHAPLPAPEIQEVIEAEFVEVPTHQLDPDLAVELMTAISAVRMTRSDQAAMLARRGVSAIVELSDRDAKEILSKLIQIMDQQRAGEILLPDPAPKEEESKGGKCPDCGDPIAFPGTYWECGNCGATAEFSEEDRPAEVADPIDAESFAIPATVRPPKKNG